MRIELVSVVCRSRASLQAWARSALLRASAFSACPRSIWRFLNSRSWPFHFSSLSLYAEGELGGITLGSILVALVRVLASSGGGLSEAYVHGFNLINEGVRQMRGESVNQVEGAEACLVTGGEGVPTSAVILRR